MHELLRYARSAPFTYLSTRYELFLGLPTRDS